MKICPSCQRAYDDSAAFCSADASPLLASNGDGAIGRVVARRYRIERLLGRGGMGSVFEATQLEIGRKVALKLLNRDLVSDPQAIERFRREARAAGRLQHPNAVTIFDFGIEENGEAFLAMEYLPGPTLRDELSRRGAFSPSETAALLSQVADAVSAAHAEGIIHRDLKPDNIILLNRGGATVVKVLDFGIAKLATPETGPGTLTGTGAIGTPFYMSPEQGEGRTLDARSDVYALGIIAFEMLTGRVPFVAETPIATVVKHINTPPPRPSQFVPTLAGPVEAVVLRALEKDPARRQQSAVEFAEALRRVAEGHAAPGVNATIQVGGPTAVVTAAPTPASLSATVHDSHPRLYATPAAVPPTEAGGLEVSKSSSFPLGLVAGGILVLLFVVVGAGGAAVYMFWPARPSTPPAAPPVSSGGPKPIVPTPARGVESKPLEPPPSTPAPPAEPVPPVESSAQGGAVRASATSVRASQGANSFEAARAIDGRLETGWSEGAEGPGVGESLSLSFDGPVRVRGLRIAPGYFKSRDRWVNNNRVARLQIDLSDGRSGVLELDDAMQIQEIPIGGDPITAVRLTILDVYLGGDEKDTLISEVEVVPE